MTGHAGKVFVAPARPEALSGESVDHSQTVVLQAGFLRDEQGNRSLARLLALELTQVGVALVVLHSVGWIKVPDTAYTYLAGGWSLVLVWAAGPRIAEYLAPQIGAMWQGLGSVFRRLAERRGGPSPDYVRPEGMLLDPGEPEEPGARRGHRR